MNKLQITFCFALFALFMATQASMVDPFLNSGCNCQDFCDYKCSINETAPENITVYRMTPKDILWLTDKDSGDASGDTSFVISRRSTQLICKKNPAAFQCFYNVTDYCGISPNCTDLVLQMHIEVDGKWGPYLECNPVNISDPMGDWNCTNGLEMEQPDNYPKQCSANWSGHTARCKGKHQPGIEKKGIAHGECCDEAVKAHKSFYQWDSKSGDCFMFDPVMNFEVCSEDIWMGIYQPPPTYKKCECERVFKSVGIQNTDWAFPPHSFTPGGIWYSETKQGECTGDQRIGDGSGCTWRFLETSKAIKASCMYDQIDKAVEKKNPLCFGACRLGNKGKLDKTSKCYLNCYMLTSNMMSKEELTKPWNAAFDGACPTEKDWKGNVNFVHHAVKISKVHPAPEMLEAAQKLAGIGQ